MSTESVVVFSLRSLSMTDNPFPKPGQTAASSTHPIQPCKGEARGKEEEEKRKKKTFRAEECLVLIYTWRRERAEGSGPCWSYAVLCDKIAQLAWTFRKRRICLTLPGRLRLYLRCPACVYPPAAQHAHPPNSCRWWVSSFFSHPPSLLSSLKPETLITWNMHRQEYTAWCRIHHYLFHIPSQQLRMLCCLLAFLSLVNTEGAPVLNGRLAFPCVICGSIGFMEVSEVICLISDKTGDHGGACIIQKVT